MRTKTNSFHLSTASCDYDVIVITETWLKSDVANSELATNYTIYRCDRSSATSDLQRGGGTLIAVKSSLFSAPVHLAGSESLEQVVVKISLAHKSVYVCGIYLRPNSDTGKYVAHSDCVHQIGQSAASNDTRSLFSVTTTFLASHGRMTMTLKVICRRMLLQNKS